jgi:hypothetical protein
MYDYGKEFQFIPLTRLMHQHQDEQNSAYAIIVQDEQNSAYAILVQDEQNSHISSSSAAAAPPFSGSTVNCCG